MRLSGLIEELSELYREFGDTNVYVFANMDLEEGDTTKIDSIETDEEYVIINI